MKKLIGFSTSKFALVIAVVLPLSLGAQNDATAPTAKRTIQEFYGRPSHWRPYDQTGINQFETKKSDSLPFDGLRVRFGAGFTQQYQSLEHKNPDALNNATANRLYPLQSGFMTAQANLF